MKSEWVKDERGIPQLVKTYPVEGPSYPATWTPTIRTNCSTLHLSVIGGGGGGGVSSPSKFWSSRWFRFAVFLAITIGFTALLTLSSKALFTVILAFGVASVVSASWKFSA